jgi:hypothetical protein
MRAHRLSIILLLGVLGTAPTARAFDAEPNTVARQDYRYDPRAGSVTLDLTTIYRGRDADDFRAAYTRLGQAGYAKAKLDYYRTMYDSVAEAAAPTIKDDPGRNVIETSERYTMSLAGLEDDTELHRFAIYPDLLRGFFSSLPAALQRPYPLDAAFDRRDIVTVDAPTLGTYAISDGAENGRYFAFTRTASGRPGHVAMDYRLRFLADHVPVEDFEQYRADIERMDHNVYAWIDLDRDFYHRYYRDIPRMIVAAAVAGLAAIVATGWWLLQRRKSASKIGAAIPRPPQT